jgi:hypothetical protein|tara:strand:+ start:295 stop:516 length:222 start_codon:yes stop_codon:yes gene_type:complete
MTLVLGIEIVGVTVFVSGLAIFFANATTLVFDASISSKADHFLIIFKKIYLHKHSRRPEEAPVITTALLLFTV